MIRRVALASLILGWLTFPASAQLVHATPQAPGVPQGQLAALPPKPRPAESARSEGRPQVAEAKRPASTAEALPRRASTAARRDPPAAQGRFANPGGVGRFSEYYTPYTPTSPADARPTRVARFDQGGGPDRAEQIAAFQAGQMRTRNIQNNINAYGRPYGAYGAGLGLGLGLGLYGGGLYGGGFR